MMKKLLSLFVAAVVATAVSAQSFKTAPAFSLQKNPVCQLDKQQKKSPAKVMAATGQLIMGTYATDEVATSNAGLGIPNYPGTIGAASYIPIDVVKSFDGGKVVKMRVGLANAAAVTRVFILPVTDSGVGAPILSQDVNANAAGWTEFDIENPVTLDFTGVSAILMGFDYTQKSTQANESYPLSMVNVGELQNVYLYGNLGNGEGWYNLGSSYGNLSVQAVVESDNFAETNIILDELTVPAFVSGNELAFQLKLHNFGTKDIEKFALDFVMDGTKILTKDYEQVLNGNPVTLNDVIPLYDGLAYTNHTFSVWVNSVDGAAPTENLDDDKAETSFLYYNKDDVVDRQKYLIEELTSHSCTYCPYGAGIVDALLEKYDDLAVACIHGNQSQKDPWNTTECESLNSLLGLNSWPSGTLNRIYSEEDGSLTRGFGYYPQYASQVADMFHETLTSESLPCFATVDVKAEVNGEKLAITVSGAGTESVQDNLKNASLTVYVTEDGIIGRQLNLGTWVSDYEHNHVLRDLVSNVVGDNLKWTSATNYENQYEVALGSDWKVENLKVVAFISQKPTSATSPDRRKMAVYNANDAIVTDPVGIFCIDNAEVSAAAKSFYTVDGRQVSQPQRGLNIVRMADGKTVKVLVK